MDENKRNRFGWLIYQRVESWWLKRNQTIFPGWADQFMYGPKYGSEECSHSSINITIHIARSKFLFAQVEEALDQVNIPQTILLTWSKDVNLIRGTYLARVNFSLPLPHRPREFSSPQPNIRQIFPLIGELAMFD